MRVVKKNSFYFQDISKNVFNVFVFDTSPSRPKQNSMVVNFDVHQTQYCHELAQMVLQAGASAPCSDRLVFKLQYYIQDCIPNGQYLNVMILPYCLSEVLRILTKLKLGKFVKPPSTIQHNLNHFIHQQTGLQSRVVFLKFVSDHGKSM